VKVITPRVRTTERAQIFIGLLQTQFHLRLKLHNFFLLHECLP